MIRFFLVILCLFVPYIIFCQVKISGKEIKVLSATTTPVSPGVVQNNSQTSGGLMYQVRIQVKKNGEFRFDSLNTTEGSLPVEMAKNNERNYKGPLKKGDVITLISYRNSKDDLTKNSSAIESLINKQKNSKGIALISYRSGSRKCLVLVREFVKETPNRLNQ